MSQEQANTVALAEHWAKVAAESKRACTQIATKLQGSGPPGAAEAPQATEAFFGERLREAVSSVRSEVQVHMQEEFARSREEVQVLVRKLYEEFERSVVMQAIAAATTEARSAARIEAEAALDKVLEVEGKTLDEWTREFDNARSELSRHSGHLNSLEAQIARRSTQTEEESDEVLPQLKHRVEVLTTSADTAPPEPVANANIDTSFGSGSAETEGALEALRSLYDRVSRIEGNMTCVLGRMAKDGITE